MTLQSRQCGSYLISWDSATNVGRVRQNNEDALIESPEIGLFGVCDGLGGHAAGEVASRIASDTLMEFLHRNSKRPEQSLIEAVREANWRILKEQQKRPERHGMGTTLSAVWISPKGSRKSWVVHIGDSRIYHLRDRRLRQLTEDHSPVFRLHRQGVLTKEEMQKHPQKNLLDRSLGIEAQVQPDVFPVHLRDGDILLTCTDGLTDLLQDEVIESNLIERPLSEACAGLVSQANRQGGFDNISLTLVAIADIDDSS